MNDKRAELERVTFNQEGTVIELELTGEDLEIPKWSLYEVEKLSEQLGEILSILGDNEEVIKQLGGSVESLSDMAVHELDTVLTLLFTDALDKILNIVDVTMGWDELNEEERVKKHKKISQNDLVHIIAIIIDHQVIQNNLPVLQKKVGEAQEKYRQ